MSISQRAAIIILISALASASCSRAPDRQHIVVSGPVHIAANVTVTLKSPEPLQSPNYWNALCLQPNAQNGLASSGRFGILSSNGEQFFPKVFLRNAAGTEDSFERSGQMGGSDGIWLCFEPSSHEQVLHTPYTEVKIVSPSDLQLNAVNWHSSDK